MNSQKDGSFYTEFVVATVVSLVSADMWIRVISGAIEKRYKKSITPHFIAAIIATIIAILILKYAFSRKSTSKEPVEKNHLEERFYPQLSL